MLDRGLADKVFIYDNEPLSSKASDFRQTLLGGDDRIVFVEGDVRQVISWIPDEPINLVANFAAGHREPSHEHFEYYQTNLLGAENVCAFAERVSCERMIFTSSISPMGQVKKKRTRPLCQDRLHRKVVQS